MIGKIKGIFSPKTEKNSDFLTKLSSLFSNSPEKAILEAQNFLMIPNFSNFEDFMNDVKKTQKSSCCIASWSKAMLSARCLDCQLHENSCICIPCYLAGKHDQHHSYLLGGSGSGNCDCGDPNFWKPSGNCPNHPGPDQNPDETQMTKENRDKFIEVFKSAYFGALTSKNNDNIVTSLNWIASFISYGDGLRRCVTIALTSVSDNLFFKTLKTLEEKPLTSLIELFGKVISDRHFCTQMGASTFRNYLDLRMTVKKCIQKKEYNKKDVPLHPVKKFLNFSFHFFNEVPLMYLIKEFQFDWVEFILDCIRFTLETVSYFKFDYDKNADGRIISELWYYSKILEVLMKKDDQHDNIQRFIDRYSQLLMNFERMYFFQFPKVPQDECNDGFSSYYLFEYLYQINCLFSPQFDSSPSNKTFSISQTFSSLLKYLKFSQDLVTASLYSSSSALISAFLPLHHLFYCLLSNHQNTAEVIKIECKKNKISLQDFCGISTIFPIRILAAITVPERFEKLNKSTFRNITAYFDKPEENFNLIFGLVQTMLGIAPNKDQILRNIVITFGINDEIPPLKFLPSLNPKKYQMQLAEYNSQVEMQTNSIYDASIFIMSLLTDRSIITFDKVLFKRLRVIELLMTSKPTSKDIESYANNKLSNPIFGDDIQSFTERVKTSNGSFFKLTNEDEFTPFFPLILRSKRTKILINYKDKLVQIPNFVEAPRGIQLKSCFRTPTFIGLMHSCLLNSSLHFNQVGLAMFVESINNGEQFDLGSYEFANPIKIETNSTIGVMNGFCKLFKNTPNFNFLTVKIKPDERSKSRSILESVQSISNLGLEALEKTDLPPVLRPNTGKEDQIKKKKKEKANHLKQQLLLEFQNKRAQFSMVSTSTKNDDVNNDFLDTARSFNSPLKANNIMCNVCQTKVDDDVLGHPCLSLPSLFPSLIDNQVHQKGIHFDSLETVFTMFICQHHVHYRCHNNLIKERLGKGKSPNVKRVYNCMIDRGVRNCFLPIFPSKSGEEGDFEMIPSGSLSDAIADFMDRAFYGFMPLDPLVPMKSYAGMVTIFEVRHRSRPECLDNPTVSILLRNLILIYYFNLHGSTITEDVSDPLVKLVYMIINSVSPKKEFKNFVRQIASFLKGDFLYEFLRRAAIIEDFALSGEKNAQINSDNDNNNNNGDEKPKFIDWDEVLSFENLIQRFEIEYNDNETIELPLFETIPLAERFVGLYQPPYNLNIFDTSLSTFVDLLTGDVVVYAKSYSSVKDKTKLPFIDDYVLSRYNGGIVMFMGLTGPNASDVIISCNSINHLFNIDGFYVDQFGDIDRGFKRGAILSLSKDRLENALDNVLSGEFILYN